MARVTKYKPLYPWLGGLNTSIDPMILDPQKLVISDNIIFSTSGSRKKRQGQAHYNSAAISAANFVYLIDYWANVSNTKREYCVALAENGNVYRSPYNSTFSTFSTLALTIAQGGITHTVQNEDLIIGIKGNDVPVLWKGQNTATNLVKLTATSGSLPFTKAWIVTTFLERLFCAGDPANPDRVYVSKVGDYQKWTASGTAGTAITLDVGSGDGDPVGITAIFPGTGVDRVLYIAKRKHLYRLDCSDITQTNWKVTLISKELGVVSPASVATIDLDDVFFASDRGVHSLNQIIQTTAIIDGQFLSFPIQNDYTNIMVASERTKMSAVYLPALNSYMLSCKRTGFTTYETVYCYNIEIGEWYRWTSVPCNFLMKRFNQTTGLDELYAGASAGFVNKLLQTALNDFGNPISLQIKSSFIAPEGVPLGVCQYTNLACVYRAHENSTFTVYYSVDGLTTQSVVYNQRIAGANTLGTTLLGPAFFLGQVQSIKPVWNHLNISEGNVIQLTFQQNGLNQDFELFGIVLEYTADGDSENAFTSPLYG